MEQQNATTTSSTPQGTLPSNVVLKHNRKTEAAQWNRRAMKRLSLALEKDPEADLLAALQPDLYAQTLSTAKKGKPPQPRRTFIPAYVPRDTRSLLQDTDTALVISPLSDKVTELLAEDNDGLSCAIIDLLAESEVLFQSTHGFSTMVLKANEEIVVKMARSVDNTTEYTSIQYLQDHQPSIPAPKPHGLVKLSNFYLLFMSFVPGLDLEKAWPKLKDHDKQTLSFQLEVILSNLRSIPFPKNQEFGGVQGEGCKDARRNIRVSPKPIMTLGDFEDFIFTTSRFESPIYVNMLRRLSPSEGVEPNCVFTHGDIRPANIKVQQKLDGDWEVVGILDWEFSGFYPAYWETLKITNTLSSIETSDWFLNLPKIVSPDQYPTRWLLDRVWDRHVTSM